MAACLVVLGEAMKRSLKTPRPEFLHRRISARRITLLISTFLLMSLIFSGIGFAIQRSIQQLLTEELRHSALNTAIAASAFIEADLAPYEALWEKDSYETGDYDALYYQKMQTILRDIRKETNVAFIYTMKKAAEEKVMYLLDGEDPESALFSPIGTLEKMDPYQKSVLDGKGPGSTGMLFWEGWGEFITGNAPIRSDDGRILGFVGVDIGTATVTALMSRVDLVIRLVAVLMILLSTLYTYRIVEDRFKAYHEDYLTKLYNRRHHDRQLEMQIRKVRKKGGFLSVMMIDVDHFKNINDDHGHETGDRMLRYVADVIRRNLSITDVCSRIGGDEFNVILPGVSLEETKKAAAGILKELEFQQGDLKVSVSIGAAQWKENMDRSMLTEAADQAMYEAKRAGRNQVYVLEEFE